MKILINTTLPSVNFVICNAEGRILRTGSAPAEMVDIQAQSGEYVFAGTVQPDDYIINPTGAAEAVPRPASPVTIDKTTVQADATDSVMLSNVGAGATVSVTGPVSSSGTGDGTPISLTFEAAGQYSITVQHFPDLDFVAVVNAI